MFIKRQLIFRLISGLGRGLMVCILGGVALLGCNKSDEGNSNARRSQIVARIGDQVISAQELETELRWANVPADRRGDDTAVKRALGDLVTRKYWLQQASNTKLDREPTVLLDILRSREQVLANAFVMREVSRKAGAISNADTDKYIKDHPSKFANRKIIAVEQISFAVGTAPKSFVDAVGEFSSLEQVDEKLTGMGIAHSRSSANLSTAEVPDDLLRSIQGKKPGDLVFLRSGQNGVFLKVKAEELRPLEGSAAIAVARQLQQNDIAKSETALANFTASMDAKFEGEYAKIMGDHPKVTN